jgi:hypothetical protein
MPMSLILTGTSHVRAGATQRNNGVRAGLLASACFAATNLVLAGAGSAFANDLTFNSVAVPSNLPTGLWYVPVGGTTDAHVNTADLNTTLGLNAIWIAQVGLAGTQNITVDAGKTVTGYNAIISTAYTDTINVVNNGTLTAAANGIYAQNTISGDINVSGTGTSSASAGNGMWLLTPSGAVNVGTAAKPIGAVSGSLNGIVINDPGLAGPSPINVNATAVSGAAGYGVWTVGGKGDQAISTTGAVSGLTGEYLNSTTGNIVADGKGTSTATGTAGQGITIGTGTGNMTVQNFDAITGTTTGAWLVGTTGSANVLNNGAITGTAVDGVLIGTTTGAINVNDNGPISGVNGVITIGGPTTVNNNGAITGTAGYGIWTTTAAGATSINGNGPITGKVVDGITAFSGTGNIGIGDTAANGAISGLRNGIWAATAGAGTIDIVSPADVTGKANYGILATSVDGLINVTANNVSGSTAGIQVNNLAGGSNVKATGAVTAVGPGIYQTSTSGNVAASGGGTGTVTSSAAVGVTQNPTTTGNAITSAFASVVGKLSGIWQVTGAGDATVTGVKTVTGSTVDGILATTGTGNISVQNTGNVGGITGGGLDGINALSATGNIDIGGTTTNGVITGLRNGVWSATAGDATNTVKVDKDVTGTTLNGIIATSAAGDTTVSIAAGATVQGGLDGVATGTLGGTATTTNAGIIKNINDTGAATDPGKLAYWALSGTDLLNNTGSVIGGINTSGPSTTVNNNTAGVWIPSLANAMAAPTTINNNSGGVIDIRTGATIFAGNSTLNNMSGGVVDLTYGGSGALANARDSLTVLNLSAKAGSIEKFNVDFTQANLAGDFSTNNGGKGTADTIIVTGASTPVGKSIVDLKTLGSATTGSSGSIALIATTAGPLKDPGLGGFATMIASSKYAFAADPSTGAVVYKLVDDGKGGVYLQWAPNLSAASLGAYGGVVTASAAATGGSSGGGAGGGGAGPGGGGGAAPAGGPSTGTTIAKAASGLNGAGGVGNSGGPSGGGAAGQVADMAAGSAMSFDTGDYGGNGGGGSLKDGGYSGPACPSDGRGSAWAAGDVSRSYSTGGGDGRSDSLAGGVEANVGDAADLGCRRLAVGVFGFTGDSTNSWATGRDKSSNDGVGGYIRASSAMGVYGSLLGAISWSDHDLSNAILGTTANKNATGYSGVATLGYIARMAGSAAVDLRTFVAYGNVDGDAFTDSAGITISGTHDDLVTVGGSIGVYAPIAPSTHGFVRGGVKWTELNSSISAAGITHSGSASEASGSVESGFVARTAEGIEFGASGFGEFSDSTTSYGGRAHVGVKF